MNSVDEIKSIDEVQARMREQLYIADRSLATSIFLALKLGKPLFLEGEAGVGKTEIAKVLAAMLNRRLIRLQCYEGLDVNTAVYEWDYTRQMLQIRLMEAAGNVTEERAIQELFSPRFLLKRPLLQAIEPQDGQMPVLLIDELDRCVTADTLIATTEGIRRAEEVRPGDVLISFDPDAFALQRSRVKKVIPRRTSTLMRLIVGGRFLEVTPEHKFVRFRERGYEVVPASALQVGDKLPICKAFPDSALREPDLAFPDRIVKLTDAGKGFLHRTYKDSNKTYAELAATAGVSRSHLRNVLQPASCRDSLRGSVLEQLCSTLEVDDFLDNPEYTDGLRVNTCVAFYELLGYIVADGCFTSDRLCIADKDRENLEIYARKFAEAFGQRPRIRRGPHRNYELSFWSRPFGRFLRRLLGPALNRSRERILPTFVYALPHDKRAGFVRGFFDGEGWVGDHQVLATSASPYLLVGIQQLLTSLGVDSRITTHQGGSGTFGEGRYYTLMVSDTLRFLERVGFNAPKKAERLAQIASTPSFTRAETLPEENVKEVLDQIRSERILHTVPGHQTLYDVLAGRIQTNVSSLQRLAEALEVPELHDWLERQVVLGEITHIESVTGEWTVYDFVLEGEPYFVANQVVTHNCDEEFEAFLLEVLSDFQITIPEIGTIRAEEPPVVVITSNRTREIHDALKRRCLYHWIDYPSFEKEYQIVLAKVPEAPERLAREVVAFVQELRQEDLYKLPGVAETLDWVAALVALDQEDLTEDIVNDTLGVLLKYQDDIRHVKGPVVERLLARAEQAVHGM